MVLVLDVETDTHNKGHPFDPRNICVSYATINSSYIESFRYYTDPDFISFIRESIRSCEILVGFNIKFDLHWMANLGIDIPESVKIWDCQIAQHIIEGQQLPYLSLDTCLDMYGLPLKSSEIIHNYWELGVQTRDILYHELMDYNLGDIRSTMQLYEMQRACMDEKQVNLVFVEGEDMRTLMAAERAGIQFDTAKATQEIANLETEINNLESNLRARLPDGIPAGMFNWDSGDHLSCLLYGGALKFRYVSSKTTYKTGAKAGQEKKLWSEITIDFPRLFRPIDGTELKKTKEEEDAKVRLYSTDQTILAQLKSTSKAKLQLLADLHSRSKKIKVMEMLQSILKLFADKHWENNLIHGQYNQTVAVTGRLSSSSPNMQNTPPEVDKFLVSRYAQ